MNDWICNRELRTVTSVRNGVSLSRDFLLAVRGTAPSVVPGRSDLVHWPKILTREVATFESLAKRKD